MIVREFEKADIGAVTDIYQHHVQYGSASFEVDPPAVEVMTARFKALCDDGYPVLVAQEPSGHVCGYAYAGPYNSRVGYRMTVEDSIYVHPDHVKRGIGTALISRLVDAAITQKYRQMIAQIGDSENHGSIKLHENAGFQIIGTAQAIGFKHNRFIDVVFMQRPLYQPDTHATSS